MTASQLMFPVTLPMKIGKDAMWWSSPRWSEPFPHDIAENVIYIESPKDLWDELKERFSLVDYFQISDLLQEIHSIKQEVRSIAQFFT